MKKRKRKTNTNSFIDEKISALELDMRRSGYLLPTNDEELKEFEKIHGTSRIPIPKHLENIESILINNLKNVQSRPKEGNISKGAKNNKSKLKSISKNDYFKRLILAAEIASRLHLEPTFGHVKFAKIYYLCNEICSLNL